MRGFSLIAAVLVAGCGGNVVVDGSGTGGAGGAPTTSTSTTFTTITTGTFTTSTTSTSTTSTTTTTTTVTGCPAPFPGIEAACTAEGEVCPVPLSCCGGSATCTNGFWKYDAVACPLGCTPPCGPDKFACEGTTVCVTHIGSTTTYACEKDPCPAGALSCACAAPLCNGMMCNNVQMGFKLLCD